MSKKMKLRTIIAGIRKNGYPKGKNDYHNSHTGTYCALGQAGMNLGYVNDVAAIGRSLHYNNGFFGDRVYSKIIELNDHTSLNLAEIADAVELAFKDSLNFEFNIDANPLMEIDNV